MAKKKTETEVPPTRYTFTKIVKETDKAWCLRLASGEDDWFPKSQCDIENDDTVVVPDWIVKDRARKEKEVAKDVNKNVNDNEIEFHLNEAIKHIQLAQGELNED